MPNAKITETESLYYDFEEHVEFPLEDAKRFTVKVRPHLFEADFRLYGTCKRCGFQHTAPCHRLSEIVK